MSAVEWSEDCCWNDLRDRCIGDKCECGCHQLDGEKLELAGISGIHSVEKIIELEQRIATLESQMTS